MSDTWMVEAIDTETGEWELLSGWACFTRAQARDEIAAERKRAGMHGWELKLRAVRYRRVEQKTKEACA